AVRYPRGNGLGVEIQQQLTELEIGKAEIVAEFNTEYEGGISILAFGSRVQPAIESAKQLATQLHIAVRVVNMRFVKPLDE
ncbi:hypothetical protein NL369_29715, partial [Klebsiella pneumoniae]|nr:hypothetical protein [Klebsiella pneumoniae]